MLREYEFTVIASSQLNEEDTRRLFEKYEGVLLADGGEIIKKSDWGVKKLAFPIKRQFRGRYLSYDLTAKPEHLAETERLMKIDENVLRFLSVKIGENVDPEERRREIAKREAMLAEAAREEKKLSEVLDENDK